MSYLLKVGIEVAAHEDIDSCVKHVYKNGKVCPGFSVALNAEKIIRLRKDKKLLDVIKDATHCYADGAPVSWYLSKKGLNNKRVAGTDFWLELMTRSNSTNEKVYLLGGTSVVVSKTAKKLTIEKNVNIVGQRDGYSIDFWETVEDLKKTTPTIVCVAMGSPKQEILIKDLRKIYPNAHYLGVGGSFDVYCGLVKRAPSCFRRFGLEWFWRLLTNPARIKRQYVYVYFLILFILNEL
jgi:UDP-N-acetyl-D-mannosaminouronate:lipid I N-acetyl-D-mannosaminouronosyltransferase